MALQKRRRQPDQRAPLGLHARRACLMIGMGFVGFVESPYAAIALLSLAASRTRRCRSR